MRGIRLHDKLLVRTRIWEISLMSVSVRDLPFARFDIENYASKSCSGPSEAMED